MKYMKTKTIRVSALVLSSLCALLLASCSSHGGTSNGSSGAESSSVASVAYQNYDVASLGDPKNLTATVTFWTTYGKNNDDPLKRIAASFHNDYPNITVDMSYQGDYKGIADKLSKAITTGTQPTMAICYPDNAADYLNAGAIEDLLPYTVDPTIGFLEANAATEGSHTKDGATLYGADDYVSAFWNEGKTLQKSGLYCVPFSKSTEALYYNKEMFEQNGWSVPTTWSEMWTLCRTIKEVYPGTAEKPFYPLGYDSDSNFFITLCQQKGIPYTSSTGDHYLFNNDQAKAMVNELYGYYQEGLFRTKNTLPNQANTSNYFVDGQMAMTIGSTGGTSYNDTLNFTPLPALPPHVDGKTLQVVNQGPSICVFSRATQKERYAAWLFYKYVTRSYNSAAFAVSSTGYDPVRESSFSQQVYLDWLSDNPNGIQQRTAVVTSSLRDKYFSSPVFVGSSKARVQVGNIFGNVFNGSKTVDAAFDYAINQCING